jgi:hypothetical protein
MTQILVDVNPDTITHLHEMTALYPKLSIAQLAGKYLDAHVSYQLEIEKMRPKPAKYYTPEFLVASDDAPLSGIG